MSYEPINLEKIKTYPLLDRKSKVKVGDFAHRWQKKGSFQDFISSLPHILAGTDLRQIIKAVVTAVKAHRPVVFAMGAHVIKCGLSPVILDLMERGVVSAIALNGAGIIHDFELALAGKTSEEVEEGLSTGEFGMARETGEFLNEAIEKGVQDHLGIGAAVGRELINLSPAYLDYSLLAAAYRLKLPATVHIAVGTDIIHMHPRAKGSALGEGSLRDFKIFASVISNLEGGVYFNIGSAVLLPEVFLKALTLVRNLGYPVENFVTVNMDFIKHYRPTQNVINRPVSGSGKGYALFGHHEIMLPLLAAGIIEELD
ncbi:MAG TPA: hypothetical protein VNM22_15620 [Candidatus Limnocylindrales bacterium]|nr:hypothetical protein [Candidatus Limnocylindrales bacterium]